MKEARAILTKHHGGGDVQSTLVAFEMAEIEQALLLEQQANQSTGYIDIIKTSGNRHCLFHLCLYKSLLALERCWYRRFPILTS